MVRRSVKYKDYGLKVFSVIPPHVGFRYGMFKFCKVNPKCPEWVQRLVLRRELYGDSFRVY